MRVIVYGTGAVGGTVAVALSRAGVDVTAIARGRQLAAIRDHGLRLHAPGDEVLVPLDVVEHPSETEIGPFDVILLAMKGQDTEAALEELRAAGVTEQPIFCLQNGVDNERKALRLFSNVHGITVLMPSGFVTPGEVVVYSEPQYGVFYLGLATGGHDAVDEALALALSEGNIAAFVHPDVMATKYGKLLLNLNNILNAALGEGWDAMVPDLKDAVRAEGEAVLAAAGLGWEDVGINHPSRRKHMRIAKVAGHASFGSSTNQSLARGTGSVESDFLNGEIALLGRLHGHPAPLNAGLAALGARMAREGMKPASLTPADLRVALGLPPQG